MSTKNYKRLIRILSIPVSLLAVGLVYFLQIPNPMMILIIPVVLFLYLDGYFAGVLSGMTAVLYSLYFFSRPEKLFTYNSVDMQKVMTIVLAVWVIIVLVGKLKVRSDRQVEEISRSNANFLKILSGMDVQLLVTEPETDKILFANEGMNQKYQIDFDPSGRPCWEVYHGLTQRCESCPMEQVYENPETRIEWEYYDKRMGHWFHNRESLIEWTDKRMVHLQQSFDVTESRMLEQALRDAKEQAEQSNQAKSDFLARMSHEIRTPMNAIIGMTDIALRNEDVEQIHGYLNKIETASGHLLGVINDILDMSKIEAGKFELSESDFVMEHMLTRVININNFRFEEKCQQFTIEVDPQVPEALITDQQRLIQVITNLLSNAAKFTPNEGSIHLSVHLEKEEEDYARILFHVKDDGIGLTKEQKQRLFKSFEQADGSITRRFGGTGLGLAICKTIVELMGGKIWVESLPGKGSDFYFTIHIRKGVSKRSSYLSPNMDWSEVVFLAVDPSRSIWDYFRTITNGFGITFDTAATGDEALEAIKKKKYQILFIDEKLPDMSGIALASKVHNIFADQIIVIMTSMNDAAPLKEEAERVGISRFINKPLLPSPIIDCINECFGERTTPPTQLKKNAGFKKDMFLGLRLLLVEDIEINREIIKAMLEETGIEIVEAENGQIACDLFSESCGKFDLIFMDVHMPVMDGYTAAEFIRGQTHIAKASSIPIIAMTANVFREDIERCLKAGMDDHIGKPVNRQDIIDKMKRYVSADR